jgi:hypothetical protein
VDEKRGAVVATRTYALALAVLLGLSETSGALTVKHDNGGVVLDYAKRTHRLIKTGEKVRIDGRCASACTLYLAKGTNVCITPRAVLMFHHPYHKNSKKLAKGTAEFMMFNYPKWVQNYINARGGLSRKWITIPYSYAKKYMRTC